MRSKFNRIGQSLKSSFQLSDKDKSGKLSLKEFIQTLNRTPGVSFIADDILYLYNFIDSDRDGSISYSEFQDLVLGTRKPNFESIIRQRRKDMGLDIGYSRSELARFNQYSREPGIDSFESKRTHGSLSLGMSQIMKSSDGYDAGD
jgi:hypothetical protein